MNETLQEQFGNIDIYLFDQLLKGRFSDCKTVLDVGCGSGRNLVYFLRNGYSVTGIDPNAAAITEARNLASSIGYQNAETHFMQATAEDMTFPDAAFDLVICSAVLHFACNQSHFEQMLHAMWQVLKPGGFFFARLASSIGIEDRLTPTADGRFLLPDSSERYLVSEEQLLRYSKELNGQLYEYLKTTNVQNLRCMTTWCLQKI